MADKKEQFEFNYQMDNTPCFEPITPAFNGIAMDDDSKGIDNFRNLQSNYQPSFGGDSVEAKQVSNKINYIDVGEFEKGKLQELKQSGSNDVKTINDSELKQSDL